MNDGFLPPGSLEAMMMQMMMMEDDSDAPAGPPKLTCPLCKTEHIYKPADDSLRLEDRCSHEARLVYCKNTCSICLEEYDSHVALKCGHLICANDFVKIGGRMKANAMKSLAAVTREAEEERRRALADRRREVQQALPENIPAHLMAMLSGIANGGGGGQHPLAMLQRAAQFGFNAEADDDDEDDDVEEEEDDGGSTTDEEMPPLAPNVRRGRIVDDDAASESSSNTDSDDELPALIGPNQEPVASSNIGNDSDDEDDIPELLPRGHRAPVEPPGRPRTNAAAVVPHVIISVGYGSDDDDDDDDVPPMIPRGDDYSSAGDSDSLPDLEQNQHLVHSSSEDGSDASDIPPPLSRRLPASQAAAARLRTARQGSRRRSGQSSDDDTSSDADSIPSLTRRNEANISDDDDDSDGPPVLLNRTTGDSNARPRPNRAAAGRPSSARSNASATRPRTAPAAASAQTSDPARSGDAQVRQTYEEHLQAARAKATKMKPSQLKKELGKMGVSYNHIIEKSELIEAYAKEKARRNTCGGPQQAAVSNALTPAPVDPYADLPALVPVFEPPENGAWIRVPKSSSVDELQYIYMEDGQLRSHSMHVFGDRYSYTPLTSYDGFSFLHAQSNQGDGAHEIYQVHCTDLSLKIFEPSIPSDTTVEMMPCGTGSFYMLYPEKKWVVESTFKLVYRSQRLPKPRTLLTNVPFSTRMYTCSSGFVWLDVGRDDTNGSSSFSLEPGLWYVSRWETKHILTSAELPDDENRFITVDAKRNGLWLLLPTDGDVDAATCSLIHVSRSGQVRKNIVELQFSKVQAIVNAGVHRDGVFVHYKIMDRWRLGLAIMGRPTIEGYADCARHSQILSCGWGGVWIWRKGGRQRTFNLTYVDQVRKSHEYATSFPRDAELVGLQEQD